MVTKKKNGLIILLSAPSGGGKSSIALDLLANDDNLCLSISATTRPKRPGEKHGIDYFFLDTENFNKLVTEDQMLEHATVYGNLYGTPSKFVEDKLQEGFDVLFDVDTNGAYQIISKMPRKSIISFFIMPPDIETLKARLIKRNQDSSNTIDLRLQEAQQVMKQAVNYDHIIVNDDFETACAEIRDKIKEFKTSYHS